MRMPGQLVQQQLTSSKTKMMYAVSFWQRSERLMRSCHYRVYLHTILWCASAESPCDWILLANVRSQFGASSCQIRDWFHAARRARQRLKNRVFLFDRFWCSIASQFAECCSLGARKFSIFFSVTLLIPFVAVLHTNHLFHIQWYQLSMGMCNVPSTHLIHAKRQNKHLISMRKLFKLL